MRASIVVPLVLLSVSLRTTGLHREKRPAEADQRLERDVRRVHAGTRPKKYWRKPPAAVCGRIDDVVSADPDLLSRANELRSFHEKLTDYCSTAMPQLQSVGKC